jgi:hypothetical protein
LEVEVLDRTLLFISFLDSIDLISFLLFFHRECIVQCNEGYAFPAYGSENLITAAPKDGRRMAQVKLKCQGSDVWAPAVNGSIPGWSSSSAIPACERELPVSLGTSAIVRNLFFSYNRVAIQTLIEKRSIERDNTK